MSEKSKLPDFKEFTDMATKLFKDVKKSVCEIIESYKKNRGEEETTKNASKHKKSDVTASEVHVEKTTGAHGEEHTKVTAVKTKKPAKAKAQTKSDDSHKS